MALGILTRRAKVTVGDIKISDILNDHQQAYTLLAQSVLYGDEELVSLALELNGTLQIAPNLIQALANYIKHLRSELTSDDTLVKHQQTLSLFGEHLLDINLHSTAYREAADGILASAEQSEHAFYLNLIRGFYPYWENTHRALIQALVKEIDGNNSDKDTLVDAWESLDSAFLTRIEESLLAAYAAAIKTINIPKEQVTLRIKMVKLILIKQRLFDKTPQGYRENINDIRKSLTSDELLAYFLSVSREFHKIWLDAQFSQVTSEF